MVAAEEFSILTVSLNMGVFFRSKNMVKLEAEEDSSPLGSDKQTSLVSSPGDSPLGRPATKTAENFKLEVTKTEAATSEANTEETKKTEESKKTDKVPVEKKQTEAALETKSPTAVSTAKRDTNKTTSTAAKTGDKSKTTTVTKAHHHRSA